MTTVTITTAGTNISQSGVGPQGNTGPQGDPGTQGAAGEGVSAGGTTGQVLTKNSGVDYDTGWETPSITGVTTVSIVVANGFSGSVATATSTPAITLQTTISGITKGSGGSLVAAIPGTDYLTPSGDGSALTGITESQVGTLVSDLSAKAPLNSPSFTGTPSATTTATSDNSTRIATTEYVQAQGYLTSAPVVSVAGNTGVVTISELEGAGLASISYVTSQGYLTSIPSTGLTITQYQYVYGSPTYSSTITLNLAANNRFTPGALTGSPTLALSNAPTSSPWVDFTLILLQDGTGGRTVEWFSGITWMTNGGGAVQPSATANSYSSFKFLQIGNGSYLGWAIGYNI